jgi:hypothetical protein
MKEGRPMTKENPEETPVTGTQRPEPTLSGLDRVRKAAREDKRLRLNNLLHHVTAALLWESDHDLNRKAVPGVDEVTWRQYGEGLEERLADLHQRVQSGRYRAKPSRRIYIPKADGRQRPIGIAAKEELTKRRHEPVPEQGRWLKTVVRGYFQYHAVPDNSRRMSVFRDLVSRFWLKALRRRSQKGGRLTWERMQGLFKTWLPPARVLHPYPNKRLRVSYPR